MASFCTDWLAILPGLEGRAVPAPMQKGLAVTMEFRVTDAETLRMELLRLKYAGTLTPRGQRLLDELSIDC